MYEKSSLNLYIARMAQVVKQFQMLYCINWQLGIDIQNCRGQGSDGAGNMSGKNKGVIKNIQDRCGKALGCHCQHIF